MTATPDELCVNTLRFLAVDAVEKAKSGHPGMPMGAAPMAYVLWTRFLKHSPSRPGWLDRDRFVLSAGHGSMLLYALLHLSGYDLTIEDLQHFRQWGSRTPGHPERGHTPGVDVTTGPLGQGFANGVGMAITEAHLAARFNRPGFEIIRHFTYAIVSDGDMMEGVSAEAASLAGHLRLGRLIYLYDRNLVSLSASTNLTFTEDCALRFAAYGWHTLTVEDGNDLSAIARALEDARLETARPSLIVVRTHLGYGAPHMQDSYKAHGSPLGAEEVRLTKERLGWPLKPTFFVPEEARLVFRAAAERGDQTAQEWEARLAAYAERYPKLAAELLRRSRPELPDHWDADLPRFHPDQGPIATRVASGKAMEVIAARVPELVGGSADLNPSTQSALKGLGDFESPDTSVADLEGAAGGTWSYAGRNISFGVREHAMGGVLNGMAAHGGVVPFGATFLVFSDYMRPAIRLAALMRLHVIYVFTHDSIGLGEDGPTHQPVEHLASLRAIPGLRVIRPCDANETVEAWRLAMHSEIPVALLLTRQKVETLDRTRLGAAEGLKRGAYLLDEGGLHPDIVLMASGSEVSLVLAASRLLAERQIRARVISMPCLDLFEAQPREYRELVLPRSLRVRLAVEAASPQGLCRYAGEHGVFGLERFGASAPGRVVLQALGFTPTHVCERALALLQVSAGREPSVAERKEREL